MSAPTKRRHGAATIDLVLCSVRQGRLHVLVMRHPGGEPVLPYTRSPDVVEPEQAARDLSAAITGHPVAWLTLGAVSAARRHPAGAVLSISFVGVVGPDTAAPDGSSWKPLEALSGLPPRQKVMTEVALKTLRLHMDVSPVAFQLLPASFTLSDLQQVYEVLLGTRLHKASFRRALHAANLVSPTDRWRSEGRGRPAQLFRYAPRKRRKTHHGVQFDRLVTSEDPSSAQ